MKEKIWGMIAWLVAVEWIQKLLINSAKKRPYIHIGDYMKRWWLIKPYKWLPFAVRIHWIQREDKDPYLHDHPFNFRTFVMKGYYLEEDVFGTIRKRSKGETYRRSAHEFHRICELGSPYGVWSLFIIGKKFNPWGFMVDTKKGPRKIVHTDYISENGRDE